MAIKNMVSCSNKENILLQSQRLINKHIHETRGTELCDSPTVSVVVFTFNDKNFIRESLDSIIIQKTNFSYEIIIGDDCSTDGTTEIIREYQNLYPERIRLLIADQNLWNPLPEVIGLTPLATIQACRAKYIALTHGDDYWTDPLKLQKQVDFLEAHADYVMCHTNARIVDSNGEILQESLLPLPRDYSGEELAQTKDALVPTASVCFRKDCLELPDEFFHCYNGDTFMFSILGCSGKSKYLGDIEPSVYRQHSSGVWSSLHYTQKMLAQINTYYWMSRYYFRIGKNQYAQYLRDKHKDVILMLIKIPFKVCTKGFLKGVWENVWKKYHSQPDHVFDIFFSARFFYLFLPRLLYVYTRDFVKFILRYNTKSGF